MDVDKKNRDVNITAYRKIEKIHIEFGETNYGYKRNSKITYSCKKKIHIEFEVHLDLPPLWM
jgi:hypothetical protein